MSGTHEPRPQSFPRSAQDLRSTNLCPYCFTLIAESQRRCDNCSLDLSLPELAKVHARSVRIADLLDERALLLAEALAASTALQQAPAPLTDEATAAPAVTGQSAFAAPPSPTNGFVAPTPPSHQAPTPEPTPAPATASATGAMPGVPTQPTPAPRPRQTLTAPMLILAVGITFLAIAAAVFLTVAFVTFSLTTKALITAAITLSTMGIASVLRWRKLTATAEGVAVLGGILLTLDAWAIQALNFFGLASTPNSLYWGSALSIISLLCAGWGWVSKLRAPRLMAALACIPGASSLVFGLLGYSADLPVLIPLGIALIVAATALLSRAPARPLEAGAVIAASHIAVLTVILTPWFEEPEPWAWTVAGHCALVVALIVQMAAFGREDRWRSLVPLRYSAAILAAMAWMSAASYADIRIEPALIWGSAVFAALAGLGLVIADAVIRPRARAAGVVANITLGLLWLPLLLGTTLPTAIKLAFTRAVDLHGEAATTDSPELLAFGVATLAAAACAAGLYALLGRGRNAEHDEVGAPVHSPESLLRSRANLVAAAGAIGLVSAAWALPTLIATILLMVLVFAGAVIGGWGLARKGGVNLALQADLLMGMGAVAVLFTQQWGTGGAALVGGGLLIAGVIRTVLANAGAQGLPSPADHFQPERTIRALAGTALALMGAVSVHFHLLLSQQDWPGYVLTAGLAAAGILAGVPLVCLRRLRTFTADLLAVGGGLLAVLDTVLLLVSARKGLWLEPGMIAATTVIGIAVAAGGCLRLASASSEVPPPDEAEPVTSRLWPRAVGAPIPVFVSAAVAALGHLIGRTGTTSEATPWMILGQAPTVLGVSALITAVALLLLRVRSGARAKLVDQPTQVLNAPAAITVTIAGVNLVGITQHLATGTIMLADGAGLLATTLAFVALGAVLGRSVPIGPPISWAGAAIIGIYGPAFLNATLVDPWPLLVMLPLMVALAASALGFATRPAACTRMGAWSVAALISGANLTLLLSLIATANSENMPWMHVLALVVALVARLLTTVIRLSERLQSAAWLLSVTAGVGAAIALAQIISDIAMSPPPASALVACVSALLIALPTRLQGRMVPAQQAPAQRTPVQKAATQQTAAHTSRPPAAPIAPTLNVALALLACADIIVVVGLMLALSAHGPGLPFAAHLGGLAAGAGLGGIARLLLMHDIGARTPIDTQNSAVLNRALLGAGVVPIVSTALVAISATLAFSSGLRHLLETAPDQTPSQLAVLANPVRIHHSVLMAIGAAALAVTLVYLVRRSGITGCNTLANAAAASLPATVWAAVMALPGVGEWSWWPLLSAGVGAIVLVGAAVMTRRRVGNATLWAAAATVPLPLIALLVPQAGRAHVGVGMMFVAAALCVLLFAAPPAHEHASSEVFTALRGMSVVLALLGAFVLNEVTDAYWLPALSLPAGALSVLAALGLHFDRARNSKAAGEAPVYAALAPVLAVASLVWSADEAGGISPWWSLGFIISLGGAAVLCALGLRLGARPQELDTTSADASPSAPILPFAAEHTLAAALVGSSVASLFALWSYANQRSFYGMPALSWVDYGVGVGLACALLVAAALSAWSTPSQSTLPSKTIVHQLPVIATGGGVSLATAILGVLMVNTGTFPAEGMTLSVAFLALSLLAAFPVVVSGVAPTGATFTRTVIVGLIAAAAVLHRAVGALVTGHDTAVEIFVVPLGLALLLVGILAIERGVGKTSWITCSPGLVLLVGIPVIAEAMERGAWRIGMMTVVIVAVIVVGVMRRLQAPLLAGSAAALIHAVIAIRTALPELVVPWWVWLSIAGLILVVVASTYEARLRDARRLGEAVRVLR